MFLLESRTSGWKSLLHGSLLASVGRGLAEPLQSRDPCPSHVTSLSLGLSIWRIQCPPLSGCHCAGRWGQLPAE